MPHPLRRILVLLPAAVLAGCTGFGGGDISATPADGDWSPYANSTVTVKGNAGNSPLGPIVRFPDAENGYIALKNFAPWPITAVGRPVQVKGKIVAGAGFRAERYVLDVKDVQVTPPEQTKSRFGP